MPGTFFQFPAHPRLCFVTSILVNILKNAQKDDKFGSQLYFSILFRQPKNLFYWPPCEIIRSAETITFLVESRLSKVMFIVNAAIYPNIFAWALARIYFFNAFEATSTLYSYNWCGKRQLYGNQNMGITHKNLNIMLERKARVPFDLQTHKLR